MQFELVEQLTVDAHPFLWVMPKRRESFIDAQKRQCGCTEIYPVVLELLPPPIRRIAEKEMKKYGTHEVGVCTCSGRIIE